MEATIEPIRLPNGYRYKKVLIGDQEYHVDLGNIKDWIEHEFMDEVYSLQYENAENTDYGLSDAIEELTDLFYNDDTKILEYVKEEMK